MTPVRLILVADDPLARAGLANLLADEPGCEVVYQTSTNAFEPELVADHFDSFLPEAVIWDLGWEVPDSIPSWAAVPVPVVALLPDGMAADQVWAAGVRGLLPREIDADALVTAVHTAVQGLFVLDPTIAKRILPAADLAWGDTAVETLTTREKEVLQLVAEGLTNKAVAQKLHISDHTVKFHVNAIMTKLGAQSRTEAVVRATRLGLILL